jgi:hypothetical protein
VAGRRATGGTFCTLGCHEQAIRPPSHSKHAEEPRPWTQFMDYRYPYARVRAFAEVMKLTYGKQIRDECLRWSGSANSAGAQSQPKSLVSP